MGAASDNREPSAPRPMAGAANPGTAVETPGMTGLTSEQASRQLTADGPNELPTARPRNLVQQARDVLREPMLLLLVGAGILYFLLAEPLDGIILTAFVGLVIAISLYQEHRTESALSALRDLSSRGPSS